MNAPAPVITPELRSLLRRVKLGQLMATLPERLALARARDLSHAEFLELVLSDEVTRRDATSAQRRARAAGLDPAMRLENFDNTAAVTYDRQVLDELFSLRFVADGRNAIIMGPVGTGKTFLATALGHAAVRRRHSVHFERAGQLLKRLKASRLDNSHDAEIRKLLRADLLILDDYCLQPMDAADRRHLRDHRRAAPHRGHHHHLQPRASRMARPDGRPAARPVRHRPAPVRRLRARPRRRVLPAPPETGHRRTGPPARPVSNAIPGPAFQGPGARRHEHRRQTARRRLRRRSPPWYAAHATGPPLQPQDCCASLTRRPCGPVLTPEPLRPLRQETRAGQARPAKRAAHLTAAATGRHHHKCPTLIDRTRSHVTGAKTVPSRWRTTAALRVPATRRRPARTGKVTASGRTAHAASFEGNGGVAVDGSRIQPTADVDDSAELGPRTVVWHLAQIRENARLGADCIVGRGAYVGPAVVIGDQVKLQNYALVYEPARLEDNVFIGPAAVLTNDVYPRAADVTGKLKRSADWDALGVIVRQGASVGAHAVILAGVVIGRWALVAAGAVVTTDVPDYALVAGMPARRIGWVGHAGSRLVADGAGRWRCPETGEMYQEAGGALVLGPDPAAR